MFTTYHGEQEFGTRERHDHLPSLKDDLQAGKPPREEELQITHRPKIAA